MAVESLVDEFTHLKNMPNAEQALAHLQRIASLVKPIMKKHGWRLPVLAEFFPDNPSLLGLNVNGGEKILIRLRPHWNRNAFLDEQQLIGTMLHELTHNTHGPHDAAFYKALQLLEDEYNDLRASGWAGEGFHAPGRRVGQGVSHDLPVHAAKSKAAEAAEKRAAVQRTIGRGGRLGGAGRPQRSPREMAAEAAERRAMDQKTCGTVGEVDHVAEAAKAAKDSVTSRADDLIGLTLDDYADSDDEALSILTHPSTTRSNSARSSAPSASSASGSRPSAGSRPPPIPWSTRPDSDSSAVSTPDPEWACPTCTLLNPALALQCAACTAIRPVDTQHAESNNGNPDNAFTRSDNPFRVSPPNKPFSSGWACGICGEKDMPHDFWSCRFCGAIKVQS